MTENKHYKILDKMTKKHIFTYVELVKACSGNYSDSERWINDVLCSGKVVRIIDRGIEKYRVNV